MTAIYVLVAGGGVLALFAAGSCYIDHLNAELVHRLDREVHQRDGLDAADVLRTVDPTP